MRKDLLLAALASASLAVTPQVSTAAPVAPDQPRPVGPAWQKPMLDQLATGQGQQHRRGNRRGGGDGSGVCPNGTATGTSLLAAGQGQQHRRGNRRGGGDGSGVCPNGTATGASLLAAGQGQQHRRGNRRGGGDGSGVCPNTGS